jgi:hypothetical protein
MTYTVWCRGQLLGESPLDFIRSMTKLRVGFLHATPLGEELLPQAGGTCAAANALHRAARQHSDEDRARLPECAAFLAAIEKSESFELELRGPDGSVIPTRYVAVRDFGFLDDIDEEELEAELARELADAEFDTDFGELTLAELGFDDWDATWNPDVDEENRFWDFDDDAADELWRARKERDCERRMSRYQLQVELIDERSIP